MKVYSRSALCFASLFLDIPYHSLQIASYDTTSPRHTIPTDSVSLFDFRDIASDNALTLGRRNAWRDYLDVYTLLHGKYLTLSSLITDAEKRFGNEFSSKLFLQHLSYTEDIHDESAAQLFHPESKETITTFIVNEVKNYLREQSIT